jgi:hypothetical protein
VLATAIGVQSRAHVGSGPGIRTRFTRPRVRFRLRVFGCVERTTRRSGRRPHWLVGVVRPLLVAAVRQWSWGSPSWRNVCVVTYPRSRRGKPDRPGLPPPSSRWWYPAVLSWVEICEIPPAVFAVSKLPSVTAGTGEETAMALFMSYSSQDRSTVDALANTLRRAPPTGLVRPRARRRRLLVGRDPGTDPRLRRLCRCAVE